MNPFLEDGEREKLDHLLAQCDMITARRIRLLLLADEAHTARQISELLPVSRSQVYYWVRRFRLKRFEALAGKRSSHTESERLMTQAPSIPDPGVPEVQPKIGNPDHPLPGLMASPGVLPGDTLAEAGRKVLLYNFAQMLAHEAGTVAGEDIEELHDMRVATRRMRAAFDVFGGAFKPKVIRNFLKDLRATGRRLGTVRDLDVFEEKVQHYLAELPEGERHGLDDLLNAWHAQREVERGLMLAHLNSKGYAEFKRQFNNFLHTPGAGVLESAASHAGIQGYTGPDEVRQIVPLLVYNRLAVVNAYNETLAYAAIEQLHALRIEFKRLRYTLEYFSEVLGPEGKQVVNTIKLMQDHLGDLNDADVACQMMGKVLLGWENQHRHLPLQARPSPKPVVDYLAYRAEERHRLLVSFPAAWERFNQPETRQNLALAIAAL